MMLSNLTVNNQKFIFLIDSVGQEKISKNIITNLLLEQNQNADSIRSYVYQDFKTSTMLEDFEIENLTNNEQKINIILPPLSDLLVYHRPSALFQFVDKLKKNASVKRIFLWATPQNIFETESFVIPYFEHMSDLVVQFKTNDLLSICTRNLSGFVTKKYYTFRKTNNQFMVELVQNAKKIEEPCIKPERLGTFKIELEEDELVARNALKLPYERTSETNQSNIIYTPDDADDFDDEDPDEDLYI